MSLRDNDNNDLHDDMNTSENPKSQSPGYGGFLEMITAPAALGASRLYRQGAIIATAVLIYGLGFCFSQFISLSSPELVEQLRDAELQMLENMSGMQNLDEEQLQSQQDNIYEKFEDPLSTGAISINLGLGLGMGIIYVFFFGTVFWLFARLLIEEPPTYVTAATLVAYGAGIGAIGMIVTALMQAGGNSFLFSPSPAIFYAGEGVKMDPIKGLMIAFNVFDLWKYLAVGVAVAAQCRMSTSRGITFGLIAFAILLTLLAIPSVIGLMFTGGGS